jgi:ribose 5-phosphate isomerase A
VPVLGKFPLPVEVIKMALPLVEPKLAGLGFTPKLRRKKDSTEPFKTDEGNYILDCWSEGIAEPESAAAEIRSIVGVVEHGLFLGMATVALVGGEDGVKEYRA